LIKENDLLSLSYFAFDPDVIDERLGVYSYTILQSLFNNNNKIEINHIYKLGIPSTSKNKCLNYLEKDKYIAKIFDPRNDKIYYILKEKGIVSIKNLNKNKEYFDRDVRAWLTNYVINNKDLINEEIYKSIVLDSNIICREFEKYFIHKFNTIIQEFTKIFDNNRSETNSINLKGKLNLNDLVNHIYQNILNGKINDEIAIRFLIKCFMYSYLTNVLLNKNIIHKLEKLEKPWLLLDTNVVFGAIIDKDQWYNFTHLILKTAQKLQLDDEYGTKFKFFISLRTIEEYSSLIEYVKSVLESLIICIDSGIDSDLLQIYRGSLEHSPFYYFFDAGYETVDSYINFLYRELKNFIKTYEVEIIDDEISMELLKNDRYKLSRTFNYYPNRSSEKALEHDAYLIRLAEKISDANKGIHTWIWTYHFNMAEFEKKLIKSPSHSLPGWLIATFIEPFDIIYSINKTNEESYSTNMYLNQYFSSIINKEELMVKIDEKIKKSGGKYKETIQQIQIHPAAVKTNLAQITNVVKQTHEIKNFSQSPDFEEYVDLKLIFG